MHPELLRVVVGPSTLTLPLALPSTPSQATPRAFRSATPRRGRPTAFATTKTTNAVCTIRARVNAVGDAW